MRIIQSFQWPLSILILAAVVACTPGEPAPPDDPQAVQSPDTGQAATAVPIPEPTTPDAATTLASDEKPPPDPASNPDSAVDTSIRDAAEFGDDSLLEGLTPEGWKQAGAIEHYNVASLYDKINGRSELYMAYDVVGLSWVSFVHADDPNLFMDVFLYDMRSPTGAYGIYSVEREPGQPKVAIGREGYRTDSNHYFWKGKYYVYLQASLDTEPTIATSSAVAQKIADRLQDSGEPVQGLDLVPTEGLVADTIQYFRADAMSLDFMTDTFTAKYTVGGEEVTAFMTRRSSEDDAKTVLGQYAQYFAEYGDDISKEVVDATEFALSNLGGGFYDAVFQSGSIVAGVSAVEGRDKALAAAVEVARKLKKN